MYLYGGIDISKSACSASELYILEPLALNPTWNCVKIHDPEFLLPCKLF